MHWMDAGALREQAVFAFRKRLADQAADATLVFSLERTSP